MPQNASDTERRSPPETLSIRAGRQTDAEAISHLMNLPGVRSGTLRLPYQQPENSSSFLQSLGKDDLFIVAFAEETLVATSGLHRSEGRRRHAAGVGIAVHDEYTGCGIGTRMIGALVDAADNWLDIRRLELTVFADNAPAIALYRKFGFVEEGKLTDYAFRNGAYADAIAMARLRGVRAPQD